MNPFEKDTQFVKFCAYGFLKNLRFYDAFLLLFFLENGISFSQIGILYAAREITINIFEIPSGILADTYGRKNSLIAAFFIYILSFVAFYFSTNFSLLLAAIVLHGIGDAFRSGTHKGMIMDYLKIKGWEAHKIQYYGHTRSWSQKGSALSALFAGVMVFYSGSYRIIYLFSIVPYLLNFINIISYPNSINYSSKSTNKRAFSSVLPVYKNFISLLKKRSILRIINSAALHSSFLKSIKDYIQAIMIQIVVLIPLLHTLDIKRKSGLVIGIIYFIIFLLTSQASKISFKIANLGVKDISKSTLIFGLSMGLISGFFIVLEYWIAALLFFVLIYLIENARKPIMTGILSDQVPNSILTSVLSAQSFYGTILTASLALIFGFIADGYGIGISLLSISSLLIIFTIFLGNASTQNNKLMHND